MGLRAFLKKSCSLFEMLSPQTAVTSVCGSGEVGCSGLVAPLIFDTIMKSRQNDQQCPGASPRAGGRSSRPGSSLTWAPPPARSVTAATASLIPLIVCTIQLAVAAPDTKPVPVNAAASSLISASSSASVRRETDMSGGRAAPETSRRSISRDRGERPDNMPVKRPSMSPTESRMVHDRVPGDTSAR
jgi:hypothetical protein